MNYVRPKSCARDEKPHTVRNTFFVLVLENLIEHACVLRRTHDYTNAHAVLNTSTTTAADGSLFAGTELLTTIEAPRQATDEPKHIPRPSKVRVDLHGDREGRK